MTIYDYNVPKTDGGELALSEFKGKVIERFEPTADMKDVEIKILELL